MFLKNMNFIPDFYTQKKIVIHLKGCFYFHFYEKREYLSIYHKLINSIAYVPLASRASTSMYVELTKSWGCQCFEKWLK